MSARVTTTSAAVQLGLNDLWASEVLQACARAHCTPRQELLEILAPVSHTTAGGTASTGSVVGPAGAAVAQEGVVIDVDAEEGESVQSRAASPNSLTDEGSNQPRLHSVQPTVLPEEMEVLRAALSPVLLRKAYRLQMPCLTKHVSKAERLLNCAASPRCMAGLQLLSIDAATREGCLRAIMGDGPDVVPIPTTNVGRLNAVSGRVAPSSPASSTRDHGAAQTIKATCEDLADDSQSATATDDAEHTVMGNPAFPCLWRGVRNLMNTCYFSSVLQLIFSIARVRHAILNGDDAAADHGHPHVVMIEAQGGAGANQLAESGLKELFALMAFSRESAGADPKSFAAYLSLDVKVQQDAQEFFTLLLDWLRCHCGPIVKAAITSTFSGTLLYDRQCGACGWSFKRAEPFLYLSLPVRPALEDSLSEFSKPEAVDGFKCEKCGQTAVATSLQYMRTLPDVLVIHLNRFEFNLQTLQRHKVTTTTSFPLQLDMMTYMQQWHNQKRGSTSAVAEGDSVVPEETEARHVYELRGVVNHLGDTAVSGHYTYHGKVSSASASPDKSEDISGGSWLNFNDAEVSKLNRYQGQRGVSPEAYLLVYHRVASFSSNPSCASVPVSPDTSIRSPQWNTSSAACPPTSAIPTPEEFPVYLRQYVDRVNDACLAKRRDWMEQRAQISSLFDAWATAAKAVFESVTNASCAPAWISTAAAARASTPSLYLLPTRWLQHFGRFFLPAYVDAAALGSGAESKLKCKRRDPDAVPDAAGDGASCAPAKDLPIEDTKVAIAGLEEEALGSGAGAAAEGTVVAAIAERFCHGRMQTLEEVCQLVRQHSLQQALSSLTCAHGFVLPWASYKVVSASAYEKLNHFLSLCGVPLAAAASGPPHGSSATPGVSAAARLRNSLADSVQSGYSFIDANLCPLCAVAMAAGVKALALRAAQDEKAEACLTRVWEEAEGGKGGVAGEEVSEGDSRAVPGALTTTSGPLNAQDHQNEEEGGDQQQRVLVSRAVVAAWASFYTSQLVWGRVRQAEGYTGVLMMREARLTSRSLPAVMFPRAGAATLSASAGPSSESPTVPETVSVSFMNAGDLMSLTAFTVGGGDLNLPKQLLCPHGALRPGAHVVAIPESLRRYWVRRFVEVLTMEYRSGFLHTMDPHWSVCEDDMEHLLLPRIPSSAASTTCHECMRSSVQHLTSRHQQRMKKMEEQKRYPSLWLAGAMTSSAGVEQLMLATGAESEEQLLATQHPNRLFFRQHGEREYREYVKKWTEEHQQRVAHQLNEVQRLRTALEKKRQHDDAWNARVTMRRSRGGGGRGGAREAGATATLPASVASSPPEMASAGAAAPDPQTLEGRLYYAEEALRSMTAQSVPDCTIAYGCVPTWWVAQWYAAMQSEDNNASSSSSGNAGGDPDDQPLLALPRISFDKLKCVHRKGLLEVSWLNPSDSFWQGARAKRAEVLWNSGQAEREGASSTMPPSTGLTMAEYSTRCWLPPMTILPMDEYVPLLAQYGEPDMLDRGTLSTALRVGAVIPGTAARGAKPCPEVTDVDAEATNDRSLSEAARRPAEPFASSTADCKGASASLGPAAVPVAKARAQPVPVADAVIQVCLHNGTRQLWPPTCEECCGAMLASFEAHSESFVNGSLKLNIHVKKSRKNYYDAMSILTSSAVQHTSGKAAEGVEGGGNTIGAGAGMSPAGIHHYTTLAQLKDYISVHLRERHGYLVPANVLQIGRGKNKPLKRRSPLPQTAGAAEDAQLDDATLHELGIHDGDTLSVQSVDIIAQTCATTAAINEEWEAIPLELLQGGGGGSATSAAQEQSVAFRETRLQGNHSGFVPATSSAFTSPSVGVASPTKVQGVACSVCTFLNAPEMIVCEMCEAPLPSA
ncbi:hypothetical protein JKF63_05279 [Porcisia hertigi]|uniref:ubiquitinyl hydrolase 1 n=1 Tax=Porcisia hertigi TaxID=2761500 RepID=A0A836IWE2_9TRYP|nr:hypothetical protein JKF63_05279 [Porcisia hertigi]